MKVDSPTVIIAMFSMDNWKPEIGKIYSNRTVQVNGKEHNISFKVLKQVNRTEFEKYWEGNSNIVSDNNYRTYWEVSVD